MSKNKSINIGDKILVKQPNFITRIGYPVNVRMAKEIFISQEEKDILYNILGIKKVNSEFLGQVLNETTGFDDKAQKEYEKILKILAYNKLRQNKFGGDERKIFTEQRSGFLNREYWVARKKIVKTGIRGKNELKGYHKHQNILIKPKTNIILELSTYPVQRLNSVRGNIRNNLIIDDSIFTTTRQSNFNNKKKKWNWGGNEERFKQESWISSENVVKLKNNVSKWKQVWRESN